MRSIAIAIAATAAASVGTLSLSVSVARNSTTEEFNQFAVALLFVTLTLGIIRSAVAEDQLATRPNVTSNYAGLLGSLRLALLAAIGALLLAFYLDDAYLLVAALGIVPMAAYDYTRAVWSAQARADRALLMDSVWASIFVLYFTVGLFSDHRGLTSFIMYVCLIAAVTLVAVPFLWRESNRAEARIRFRTVNALDFLVGTGSVPFATSLLGVVAGAAVVGPLRAGGTLLSPLNLVSNAIRPIFISRIAHAERQSPRSSFLGSVGIALSLAPVAVAVQFIPHSWGRELFGDTWAAASQVLLPLTLEAILGLFTAIAFAAHRAYRAGVQTLVLRSALGIMRIGAVCGAGISYGLVGAAWAMPCVTLVGVFAWWSSYIHLSRKGHNRVRH